MMKKGIGILGLVLGVSAYVKYSNKKNDKKVKKTFSKVEQENLNKMDNKVEKETFEDIKETFENIKTSRAESIYNRHEQASDVMRETLNNIYDNTRINYDENDNLGKLSSDLDELLKED